MLDQAVEPALERVTHPLLEKKRVTFFVQRADLTHPQISGNKWYKLKYNLQEAKAQGYRTVLSFGGSYSNHLHALAFAGNQYQLKTVGIVRGEENEPLNPTLQDATDRGMRLIYLSRAEYKRRFEAQFLDRITRGFEPHYLVPEGGANQLALRGCAEISLAIEKQISTFDYLCVPCGTGATLAGLVSGLRQSEAKVLGFCALKGLLDIEDKVMRWLQDAAVTRPVQWQILHDFHCGGFAKLSPELVRFMDDWSRFSPILLEPIYTGKMFYGIFRLLEQDYFTPGARIVAIHTGGLQGLRGMQKKMARLRASCVNPANNPE